MIKDSLPSPVEYILLEQTCTKYDVLYGWKPGTTIFRRQDWQSGNGCGSKQALFTDTIDGWNTHTAWDDHVKEVTGQLELEI